MVICAIVLPLKRVHGDFWSKLRKVDFLGSALVLVAVILILLALNWGGQTFPWTSPAVLATLLVGVAVFAGFIVWEGLGAALPTIPLRLFRNRTIVGIYITTVALGVCFFIPLFYIPQVRRASLQIDCPAEVWAQFFQVVRGYSAIDAGLMLIPLVVVQVCISFLSGLTVSKTGHYRVRPLPSLALSLSETVLTAATGHPRLHGLGDRQWPDLDL